jgi:hypothetical protein
MLPKRLVVVGETVMQVAQVAVQMAVALAVLLEQSGLALV